MKHCTYLDPILADLESAIQLGATEEAEALLTKLQFRLQLGVDEFNAAKDQLKVLADTISKHESAPAKEKAGGNLWGIGVLGLASGAAGLAADLSVLHRVLLGGLLFLVFAVVIIIELRRTKAPAKGDPSHNVMMDSFIRDLNNLVLFSAESGRWSPDSATEGYLAAEAYKSVGKRLTESASPPATFSTTTKEKGVVFPVWFGTNRAPGQYPDTGFTSARGTTTSFGRVEVWVPEAHRTGEIGNSFWTRLKRWDLRDDHLRVQKITRLDNDGFWKELQTEMEQAKAGGDKPHALVFLHGYNVDFQEAAIRAAQIGYDLKVPGATAFFSWPSRGTLHGYFYDEATIDASERAITQFIVEFVRRCGAEKVHLVAHSMGNRGLLRAIQRIASQAETRGKVKFGQIILAAPDVDRELFLDLAELYCEYSERTTLYSSRRDRAVCASARFHDAPRAGYYTPHTLVAGIDTIAVPGFHIDLLGHGYFAEAQPMLNDISDLLRHNDPPNKRMRPRELFEEGQKLWQVPP